jgi:hypothetical protein
MENATRLRSVTFGVENNDEEPEYIIAFFLYAFIICLMHSYGRQFAI